MTFKLSEKDLKIFLLTASKEEILESIDDIHPADILDIVLDDEEYSLTILSNLPNEVIASVIDEADDDDKYKILSLFPKEKRTVIVNEMSSDELVSLLRELDPEDANIIIEHLEEEDKEDVKEILSYPEDTAGGIMSTEFISIKNTMTVSETLKFLQETAPDAESAYYLYVLDLKYHLKGIVSLRDLVTSPFDTKINDIMSENITSIPVLMDQEEVAHVFDKYGYLTLPVVDESDEMIGIITMDDILDVIQEEATEDINRLAGLQEDDKVDDSILTSVKSRLPWLFINLLTAILASSVVAMFSGTINKVVMLATFMPIVAGMGGNSGTQALTIIVRGIALGELTPENAKKIFLKEFGVGAINGIAIGLAVFVLGILWGKNFMLGFIICIAMFLNLICANISGFIVPVLLKKFNVDPALASAVFVTTVTDCLGFLFFLGLATMFLNYII